MSLEAEPSWEGLVVFLHLEVSQEYCNDTSPMAGERIADQGLLPLDARQDALSLAGQYIEPMDSSTSLDPAAQPMSRRWISPDTMYARAESEVAQAAGVYPQLSAKQEAILFAQLRRSQQGSRAGDASVHDLIRNSDFLNELSAIEDAETRRRWLNVLVAAGTVKDVIVLCSQRLVFACAHRNARGLLKFEERVASGLEGLNIAIAEYEVGGLRFSTLAINHVVKAIRHEVMRQYGISEYVHNHLGVMFRFVQGYESIFGETISEPELRRQLLANADGKDGLPYLTIGIIDGLVSVYQRQREWSVHRLGPSNGGWRREVGDSRSEQGVSAGGDSDDSEERQRLLALAMRQLPAVERELVAAAYGFEVAGDQPPPLEAIRLNRDLTPAAVNAELALALEHLRELIATRSSPSLALSQNSARSPSERGRPAQLNSLMGLLALEGARLGKHQLRRLEKVEAVRALRADGLSYDQIATQLALPHTTVAHYISWLMKVKALPRNFPTEAELTELRETARMSEPERTRLLRDWLKQEAMHQAPRGRLGSVVRAANQQSNLEAKRAAIQGFLSARGPQGATFADLKTDPQLCTLSEITILRIVKGLVLQDKVRRVGRQGSYRYYAATDGD